MRKSRGSAIAELGPSLLILLVLILIPVLDLLYIGSAYGFAWFVQNTEIRELSTNTPWQLDGGVAATQALARADSDVLTNSFGFAAFLGINQSNFSTRVTHPNFGANTFIPPTTTEAGQVILTTNVLIRPWLRVPFLASVPGIGTDMPFSFTTTKPQEENGQN
jgi:hypothetical protein